VDGIRKSNRSARRLPINIERPSVVYGSLPTEARKTKGRVGDNDDAGARNICSINAKKNRRNVRGGARYSRGRRKTKFRAGKRASRKIRRLIACVSSRSSRIYEFRVPPALAKISITAARPATIIRFRQTPIKTRLLNPNNY